VTQVQGSGDPSEDLATVLSRALHAPSAASDALELVYQPIVRLDDGATVAVEGLARWQRDPGGVPPEFLLQTAESAGLMPRLQEWILGRACGQLAAIRAGAWPHLVVHVNVPASLLVTPGLVGQVRHALSDHGLPGTALVLEVTETGRIDDFAAAADILDGVRRLGVRVALDDFGGGHSNLDHLLRLPVDVLKLDRALVAGVAEAGRAQAISHGAVHMARRLGIPVIAEGVERQQQAARLIDLGCDYAQGFLYSPPLPAADLASTAARPEPDREPAAADPPFGHGVVKPVIPI
jgi:EAL domain-containing protein (putative c-di-GMP-specific phosphodiesterase class I)